jgi:hypothetical protein
LPNNTVNANYNGQCNEKELFTTSAGQLGQIDKAIYPTMSSCARRQQRLGGRKSPSPWRIVQLHIQQEACGGEHTRNTLLKQ